MDVTTASTLAKDLGAWALSAIAAGAFAWFLVKQLLADQRNRIDALEKALTQEQNRRLALEDRQFNEVLALAKDAHVIAKEYAAFIRRPPSGCPYIADDDYPTPEATPAPEPGPEDTQTVLAAARAKHDRQPGHNTRFNRTRSGEHRP